MSTAPAIDTGASAWAMRHRHDVGNAYHGLWLDALSAKPDADLTLICFGPAGTGASQFRAWNWLAPSWLRVLGVRLPGREFRYREAPLRDTLALAHGIANEIAAQSAAGTIGRFGFFGHNFGALLAFETARRLRSAGARQPCWLGIAGRRAPHLAHTDSRTHDLPEPAFIEVLRTSGLFDPRRLGKSKAMGLILPAIRADLQADTGYVHRPAAPLDMPILAMRGKRDRTCSAAELDAWRDLSTAGFMLAEEEGDHFFFNHSIGTLIETVSTALRASAAFRCPQRRIRQVHERGIA